MGILFITGHSYFFPGDSMELIFVGMASDAIGASMSR